MSLFLKKWQAQCPNGSYSSGCMDHLAQTQILATFLTCFKKALRNAEKCHSRKCSYSHTEGIVNSWGAGGSRKPTNLKNVLSFIGISRGMAGGSYKKKNPSVGEEWIFYGITQLKKCSSQY